MRLPREQVTYACVAHVARAHHHAWSRGVLYFHFDLWIKPWDLLDSLLVHARRPSSGADESKNAPYIKGSAHPGAVASAARWLEVLDDVWEAPAGRMMLKTGGPTRLMALRCFNASRPAEYSGAYPQQWTWSRDVPPAHAATRRACTAPHAGAKGGLPTLHAPTQRTQQLTSSGAHGAKVEPACDPDRLCIGWADLYYVPRRHLEAFRSLASAFASTSANAELAVPTILSKLYEAGGEVPRRPACWGFCCSQTACPELMSRYACGHRMQLGSQHMRHSFARLLAP